MITAYKCSCGANLSYWYGPCDIEGYRCDKCGRKYDVLEVESEESKDSQV